jgi:hypothetical protein
MAYLSSSKSQFHAAGLAGLASAVARVSVWLHSSWGMTGKQFWVPAAVLVGLISVALWLTTSIFSGAIEISERAPPNRLATVVHAAIAIFLFGVVAFLFQIEYRTAVNPRVMGRIERTSIVVRGNHNQHVRVADVAFTVSQAGQPISCRADAIDIGDGNSDTKVGDSIELSPTPHSCEKPLVINIQLSGVMGALSALVAAAGFAFAFLAWGSSSPQSEFGLWLASRP